MKDVRLVKTRGGMDVFALPAEDPLPGSYEEIHVVSGPPQCNHWTGVGGRQFDFCPDCGEYLRG